MAYPTLFIQDCGPYGIQDHKAYKTHKKSSFVVYKNGKNWSIGHERSGLKMDALLPARIVRSKPRLLLFLSEMEAACPEACEKVGMVERFPWPDDLRPFGQILVDWSRNYVCV